MLKKIKKLTIENFGFIFRYSISGLFFNLSGYILYLFLSNYLNPILSLTILYPFIILCYFYFQNFYVFKITRFEKKKLVKFSLNTILIFFSNIALLFLATEIFLFDHRISQFIILVFLIMANFIVQKKIIFV
jgi:putative flippase GtrA